MHSGGSRFLQLGEGAIYMLDQLSCAVGALHFGEIWNQLGEGAPTALTLAPPPGSPSNRAAADPGRRKYGLNGGGRRRPPPVESVVDQIYAAKPYAN